MSPEVGGSGDAGDAGAGGEPRPEPESPARAGRPPEGGSGAGRPGGAEAAPGSGTGPIPPVPPGPAEPAWVRPLLVGGFLAFPLLAALLWGLTPLGLWDALFVACLVELLPVFSVTQVPLAEAMVAGGAVLERIPVYVTSTAVILLLGWAAFTLGVAGGPPDLLGLAVLSPWPLLLWTAGLTGAALVLLVAFRVLNDALGRTESAVLRALIPRSPAEKVVFVGLSAAAGIGEELAYRAYAIPALVLLVGSPWAAAVLSSAVFGFLHAYQGILGVCRAALLGFVLAVSLLVTGSVVPAILAHMAIDVVAGLFLGGLLDDGG